ncbi:hypothetical protein EMIHUDRAFT_210548 [Emiliania huxleyi CCMP1516]|uniref:Uncharacterized protein n=2 Tax=Emiliania huxleyi TaxID=2903 RepID=A0A0D3IYA7_EMIH1|nr:hypothetical protein EMIHUDRAFT_210548 [Emiliania huxleyi CCMP1516]EOD16242.1 hypothetical protein EMIHUDRAFT_210548 [Emiliania huxleyi CCMP1516]|eukprot:XP_005768671.1 hypothetical protein EMIHUDRAFT_210548 [Emiliania huxleyi CCMP1516]
MRDHESEPRALGAKCSVTLALERAPACAELIAGEGWAKRSAAAAYPLGALR